MNANAKIETSLFALEKNRPARICGFIGGEGHAHTQLREIGFAEGDLVEIIHIGLFGRSPLNIKLHGTAIAMRPSDAKMIRVIPADLHREKIQDDSSEIVINEDLQCCEACGNE